MHVTIVCKCCHQLIDTEISGWEVRCQGCGAHLAIGRRATPPVIRNAADREADRAEQAVSFLLHSYMAAEALLMAIGFYLAFFQFPFVIESRVLPTLRSFTAPSRAARAFDEATKAIAHYAKSNRTLPDEAEGNRLLEDRPGMSGTKVRYKPSGATTYVLRAEGADEQWNTADDITADREATWTALPTDVPTAIPALIFVVRLSQN